MPLDLEPAKLLALHGLTKDLAQASLRRLKTEIEAMGPLFRPRRYLGDWMQGAGKETGAADERNFADLKRLYAQVAVKPFDLRPESQRTT